MLTSVGKLSSIGEMLTFSVAASEPGECHRNDFDSFSNSVHFGGTVNDMPCRSHFTSWPPASAAVCAAVGCPRSADRELELLEPDELELELLPWSLSERLQRERAKPSSNRTRICFMRRLLFQKVKRSQYLCYPVYLPF